MTGRSFLHPRYWPTWTGLAVLRLLSMLPLRVLWLLGGGLGELLYRTAGSRRHVARRNIECCFPELSAAGHGKLLRRHFRAVGQSLLAVGIPWWAPPERLDRLIRYRNPEIPERLRAQGRNVILLAPHFLALEMGVWITHRFPVALMYKRAKNRLFDRVMRRGRGRFGAHVAERNAYLKNLVREIKAGRLFIYLPDQNPGRQRGVFAPFFGVPAATFPALGRFAAVTGAAVVPCLVRQLPRGAGYEIIFKAPLEDFPADDAVENARRMNAVIEEAVREMPEQYVWIHRRFKVRPEVGAADFYAR